MRHGCIIIAALCVLGGVPRVVVADSAPTIAGLPVLNTSTVVADDTTVYSVATTATDPDGYDGIRCIRILFNYTESGGNQSYGRGLMAWGKTDGDVAQYGGAWVLSDAAGGGRWGYRTDVWNGTTYMTPLSCTMTFSGKASGGSGSRTITWTFTAKPAWAHNPLMNDVDVWVADGSYIVGWLNGQQWFDVVAAPCASYCATPHDPMITAVGANSVSLAINPLDASTNVYAICISPSVGAKMFVQGDGTLDVAPWWYSRASWGTKTVTGLLPNTTYSFSVRASRNSAGYCPSGWGPGTQATTVSPRPIIDSRRGTAFSTGVRGQCPYRSLAPGTYGWEPVWDLAFGSMGRGLAGGLDADCYDWRDIDSGSGWGTPRWSGEFDSLQFLKYARDHQATPLLTANAFGGGYRDWANPTNPGVFVCQAVTPDALAADWVRYTNFIVQNYRQGDEGLMTGEDLRVYQSIRNWGGKPQLLAPGERAVPRVRYWEIGNEPEVPGYGDFLTEHYLGPTDYRDRYKLISEAMIAVDPTLKFGPCLITPDDPSGSGQWLAALAADPAVRLDFVAYHPYYGSVKANWGSALGMATALKDYRAFLNSRSAGIRSIAGQHGRNGFDLIASEWNPVNWDAPSHVQSSMANALGVVETCFTFAEDGVLGGTFWANPHDMVGVRQAFAGMVHDMGNVLVSTSAQMGYDPDAASFRFYVTKNAGDDDTVMIWGLNFDDETPVTVHLGLSPCRIRSATLKHLGKPGHDASGGDTSLTTSSGIAWDQEDVTAAVSPDNISFIMEDAEVTVLVLELALTVKADVDRDLDVDQEDFAHIQACLTGPITPVTDPACFSAMLDNDEDVDQTDVAIFFSCLSGPGVPVDPYCSD